MKYFSDKIRKKMLFDKVFMFFKFLEDYGTLTIKDSPQELHPF